MLAQGKVNKTPVYSGVLQKRPFAKTSDGYSLVELLVTVGILALLAAIAIPVFLNQKEKAYKAAAVQDATAWASSINVMAAKYAKFGNGGSIVLNNKGSLSPAGASGSYDGNTKPAITLNPGTGFTPKNAESLQSQPVNVTSGSFLEDAQVITGVRKWCISVTNNGQTAIATQDGIRENYSDCGSALSSDISTNSNLDPGNVPGCTTAPAAPTAVNPTITADLQAWKVLITRSGLSPCPGLTVSSYDLHATRMDNSTGSDVAAAWNSVATSYTFQGVANATYVFSVRAVFNDGTHSNWSTPSNSILTVPAPPEMYFFSLLWGPENNVDVANRSFQPVWDVDTSNGNDRATSYNVQIQTDTRDPDLIAKDFGSPADYDWKPAPGTPQVIPQASSKCDWTAFGNPAVRSCGQAFVGAPAQPYRYIVSASNASGTGAASVPSSVYFTTPSVPPKAHTCSDTHWDAPRVRIWFASGTTDCNATGNTGGLVPGAPAYQWFANNWYFPVDAPSPLTPVTIKNYDMDEDGLTNTTSSFTGIVVNNPNGNSYNWNQPQLSPGLKFSACNYSQGGKTAIGTKQCSSLGPAINTTYPAPTYIPPEYSSGTDSWGYRLWEKNSTQATLQFVWYGPAPNHNANQDIQLRYRSAKSPGSSESWTYNVPQGYKKDSNRTTPWMTLAGNYDVNNGMPGVTTTMYGANQRMYTITRPDNPTMTGPPSGTGCSGNGCPWNTRPSDNIWIHIKPWYHTNEGSDVSQHWVMGYPVVAKNNHMEASQAAADAQSDGGWTTTGNWNCTGPEGPFRCN